MRTKIKSSNILTMDYNKNKQDLIVEFVGGSQYLYKEVPSKVIDSFMKSDSKGSFFYNWIRNKYKTEKLPPGFKTKEEIAFDFLNKFLDENGYEKEGRICLSIVDEDKFIRITMTTPQGVFLVFPDHKVELLNI